MPRGLQAAGPDGLGAAVDTRSLIQDQREIEKVLGLKNYKTDLNYKTDKLHQAQEIPQAGGKKKEKRKSEAWVCVCGRYYTHLPSSSSACRHRSGA